MTENGFENWPDSDREPQQEQQLSSKQKPENAHTPQECPEHEAKLRFYCKDCRELLCSTCFVIQHNGHDYGADISKELKADIKKLLEETKPTHTQAQEHLEYVKKVEQETISRSTEIPSEIKKFYDPLIKELTDQRDELLREAEEKCNDDSKHIWKTEGTLEEAITDYEKAVATGRQLANTSDEQQVLREGQAVIHALQKITKVDLKFENTETLETQQREFWTGEKPKVEGLGKLIIADGEPMLKIECSGPPKTVHFHDLVKFKVGVSLVIKERVSQKLPICELKVEITHGQKKASIPVPPTVERHGNQWLVCFQPVVAGHHTVTLSAETEFARKILKIKREDSIKIMKKQSIEAGDKVRVGPDWSQAEEVQGEGEVVDVAPEDCEVEVRWKDGKKERCKWGQNGLYEVQVAHSKCNK